MEARCAKIMAETGTKRGGSYPKSDATQASILAAALSEFGAHGFAAATTRRIADAAGVTLPSIAYHFGGKEGLYVACAHEIVRRFQEATSALIAPITQLASGPGDPDAARTLIADTLKRLLRLFLDPIGGQTQADFAMRALRERGPGFAILHDQLWAPGVAGLAQLVAVARGGQAATPADRTDALLLISSLLAFAMGREVSLKLLGHASESAAVDMIDAAIERRVAQL